MSGHEPGDPKCGRCVDPKRITLELVRAQNTEEGRVLLNAVEAGKGVRDALSTFLDKHHADVCYGCELEGLVYMAMHLQEEALPSTTPG